MKNTPLESERSHKLQLVEKTGQTIRIMRWKAIILTRENHNKDRKKSTEWYELKSLYYPKQVLVFLAFDNDLVSRCEKYQ